MLYEFLLMAVCSRRFPTMQHRDQEIRRIHADPAYGYYWQKVGV